MATRTVLVTGASSGIGAATAKRLADAGLRVFGTSRLVERSARVDPRSDADESDEWGAMDVCDEASVEQGVAQVIAAAERLAALVCNAGFGIFGSVEDVAIDDAQRQLDTNFFGVLRTLRAALPHLREAAGAGGDCRVVLVGSLAGRAPIPFQAHYSASKAAVDALASSLSAELQPFGIQVSLVEPGDIDTPFNAAMDWGKGPSPAYAGAQARCEAVIRESLPKAPGPEVVADAVLRALTERRARTRYAVGADSKLVPLGKRLFPERLVRRLIRDHFEL